MLGSSVPASSSSFLRRFCREDRVSYLLWRGKKRAIIAIARMILTAIYSILSNGEVWNPVDLYKIDMPEHLKEKQLAKTVKQAIAFLEKQGLKVS